MFQKEHRSFRYLLVGRLCEGSVRKIVAFLDRGSCRLVQEGWTVASQTSLRVLLTTGSIRIFTANDLN